MISSILNEVRKESKFETPTAKAITAKAITAKAMSAYNRTPDLNDMLRNCIAGQGRTSNGKQFVFLCGDYTYKGPYDRNSKKSDNVRRRSDVLKQWGATSVIYPIDFVQDRNGTTWIVYDNLMKDMRLETTYHQESFSQYQYYKIAVDSGLPDLLQFIKMYKRYFFENYDTYDLVLSFVYLYILGSGDAGLYNVIIDNDKHQIWIIDYDEDRSAANKNSSESMFYFTKPPSKDIEWFQHTGHHYKRIADHLYGIRETYPEYTAKMDNAIWLLDTWYQDWEQRYSSFAPKQPIRQQSESAENFGQMYAAHRNAKTYSGFDFGVAKSALQKYIRRGITDKALMVATEMYRIWEVEVLDGIKARSLLTNFINRLCVIAVEDIGVANMSLAVSVVHYFSTNYVSGQLVPPLDEVLYIVTEMCKSKKTRISSHVKNIYTVDKCIGYAFTKWKFTRDTAYTDEINQFIDQNFNDPVLSSESNTLKELALAFFYRLKQKDYNAVAWLNYYIKNLQDPQKRAKYEKDSEASTMIQTNDKNRITYYVDSKPVKILKGNPMIIIWDLMNRLYSREALNILRQFYFNNIKKVDTFAFLMIAVVAIINNVDYQYIDFINKGIDQNEVQRYLRGDYHLVINEDYVFDKHTKGGVGGNKSLGYFRRESSHVENEDMRFHIEAFYDTYVNCY